MEISMNVDNEYNLTVGLRIRELRESLHESREKFSEKCDISPSFLSDMERGKKSPTAKTIYKICTACSVSSDYIILGHKGGYRKDTAIELLSSFSDEDLESITNILCELQKFKKGRQQ
jgi:transcriptional regulator with XRE-family HTH domain